MMNKGGFTKNCNWTGVLVLGCGHMSFIVEFSHVYFFLILLSNAYIDQTNLSTYM